MTRYQISQAVHMAVTVLREAEVKLKWRWQGMLFVILQSAHTPLLSLFQHLQYSSLQFTFSILNSLMYFLTNAAFVFCQLCWGEKNCNFEGTEALDFVYIFYSMTPDLFSCLSKQFLSRTQQFLQKEEYEAILLLLSFLLIVSMHLLSLGSHLDSSRLYFCSVSVLLKA